ncbi:hypothetical protein FGO68_gene7581 [Halteria grandinella]|uniref:Arf-GAP domain-containing protein n=1 Tax=Halteria grandinella TaxID=5974 RepID=A0A8J8NT02_HALGN|nr:hypothetical protein FGO68_gene7581 [Halteria grandinella]
MTNGVFLCSSCISLHRQSHPVFTQPRSLTLDDWSDQQLRYLSLGGNARFKGFLEKYGIVENKYKSMAAWYYRRKLKSEVMEIEFQEEEPSVVEGLKEMPLEIIEQEKAMLKLLEQSDSDLSYYSRSTITTPTIEQEEHKQATIASKSSILKQKGSWLMSSIAKKGASLYSNANALISKAGQKLESTGVPQKVAAYSKSKILGTGKKQQQQEEEPGEAKSEGGKNFEFEVDPKMEWEGTDYADYIKNKK